MFAVVVSTVQELKVTVYDPDGEGELTEEEAQRVADEHIDRTLDESAKRWTGQYLIWHNHNRATVVYEY